MKYDPAIHKRKSIRLKGYDYSQAGLYFITICIQNRELLLGQIENDEMILNDAGKMVQAEWEKLPQRFKNVELDEFVVMPNHFHGILQIVGATLVVALDDKVNPNGIDGQNETFDINDTGQPSVGAPLVGALNDKVTPNGIDGQNETFDINDTGQPSIGATLVVAPDDRATPNDTIVPNNVVIVKNDIGAQRETFVPNDTGQPQKRATTRVAPTADAPDKTIGDMIAAFKSTTTVEYIRGVKNSGWQPINGKLWQRNYYEHIIRNERAHETISDYLNNNPASWREDKFYRT